MCCSNRQFTENVWVDGVNISTLGLEDLRRKLAIIPQEQFLFSVCVKLHVWFCCCVVYLLSIILVNCCLVVLHLVSFLTNCVKFQAPFAAIWIRLRSTPTTKFGIRCAPSITGGLVRTKLQHVILECTFGDLCLLVAQSC